MNIRNRILAAAVTAAAAALSCDAPSSDPGNTTATTSDATVALPLVLHLTTIKMKNASTALSNQTNVYVTLPGLASTRLFVGYYTPNAVVTDPRTQFNCSSLFAPVDSQGNCTVPLPLSMSVGPSKFTGTFPANTNSVSASVKVNNTVTSFTVDGNGKASKTCASDGTDLTVCWQVALAVPVIVPPLIETVFYPAPGELSQVGLQQMNQIATKVDVSYQESGGVGVNLSGNVTATVNGKDQDTTGGGSLAFQASSSGGFATTITTGSATGFMLPSSSLLPNPDENLYLIKVGAHATWTNYRDGTPPTYAVDLSTGKTIRLKLGWLRGLAQTPQVISSQIPAGDISFITSYITPQVAQQFVAQDPFSSGQPIATVVAAKPKRFVRASPATIDLPLTGITMQQQVNVKQTDQYQGQSTGLSNSFALGPIGVNFSTTETITTTYSNISQSTATIQLQNPSTNMCFEGTVDLYIDTALGTILPVPHLTDTCNAPNNKCPGNTMSNHVLLPGQSMTTGQVLTSCNGRWSLTMQADGSLVERYTSTTGQVQITTGFYQPGITTAIMQTNGGFVLKSASGSVLFDSGTRSSSGAYFILQDDGYLNIYNQQTAPMGVGGALPALWTMVPG